ncbi:MFS transporter, partial [Morganella morganii]|uniref:MFS transporter n=1 Tax=Morganella morganii TaxID=582 RepID=UPI001953CDF1
DIWSSIALAMGSGITKTCFVLISAMFMDRFGRRPMLMLGSCGMDMSLFLLGFGCTFLKLLE